MDTNETRIYTAVLIAAIVIGGFIIYFTWTTVRNHRKYFRMLKRNFLEEMEILERERTRIAQDLHDELGPLLAVTKFQIESARGATEKDQHYLESAKGNIEQLTERFSGIAKNLTPRVIVSKGLETALIDFFEQFKGVSSIRMNLDYRIRSSVFIHTALQLYRIVQELVHNAVKHSGATELLVQLLERKRKIYLYYKDNGSGIQNSHAETSEGLGLSSLHNRAAMLGGTMSYNYYRETGTEYFFEIPLIKNQAEYDTNRDS
jgi:signal transduction histidine kinase